MRKAVLTALFAIFASFAFAQSDRGTITGTVSDPAGAVVANAASNGGAADNPPQQQSTIDVRPVQQSGPDSGSDDGPGRGPGRPPCHHHGGSGGSGSGGSGSSSGSSGSSGQI